MPVASANLQTQDEIEPENPAEIFSEYQGVHLTGEHYARLKNRQPRLVQPIRPKFFWPDSNPRCMLKGKSQLPAQELRR